VKQRILFTAREIQVISHANRYKRKTDHYTSRMTSDQHMQGAVGGKTTINKTSIRIKILCLIVTDQWESKRGSLGCGRKEYNDREYCALSKCNKQINARHNSTSERAKGGRQNSAECEPLYCFFALCNADV
jgi:hypothetical protein